MFRRDYIIRQIEEMCAVLASVVFGKKRVVYQPPEYAEEFSDSDRLYLQLKKLVRENRLNEAEDLLFSQSRFGDKSSLAVALDFYETLNEMDDGALAAANYSREEIRQGLTDFAAQYGFQL